MRCCITSCKQTDDLLWLAIRLFVFTFSLV